MAPLRCVLLVDDDPTTRYLHRLLLDQLGLAAHVLEAANGQQALDLVLAQRADDFRTCPDLILLDVHMPGMNGFEFLEAYTALSQAQQCARVVALLTTSVSPRDVERAGRLSVSAYLTKPLMSETLSGFVHERFAPPSSVQ